MSYLENEIANLIDKYKGMAREYSHYDTPAARGMSSVYENIVKDLKNL